VKIGTNVVRSSI